MTAWQRDVWCQPVEVLHAFAGDRVNEPDLMENLAHDSRTAMPLLSSAHPGLILGDLDYRFVLPPFENFVKPPRPLSLNPHREPSFTRRQTSLIYHSPRTVGEVGFPSQRKAKGKCARWKFSRLLLFVKNFAKKMKAKESLIDFITHLRWLSGRKKEYSDRQFDELMKIGREILQNQCTFRPLQSPPWNDHW